MVSGDFQDRGLPDFYYQDGIKYEDFQLLLKVYSVNDIVIFLL